MLAHSSITAAVRPAVTGYGSQIEFAQWIVLLGCARCKELDKHKSTQGSCVFICQRNSPTFFFTVETNRPAWQSFYYFGCAFLTGFITLPFNFPMKSLRFRDPKHGRDVVTLWWNNNQIYNLSKTTLLTSLARCISIIRPVSLTSVT